MRIDVRSSEGQYLFSKDIDPRERPSKVAAHDGSSPAIFLQWEQALDDRKRLRHCLVCGCPDLYSDKQLPPLTLFVVVMFAAAVVMTLTQIYAAYVLLAWGLFLGLLISDLLIRSLAPRSMACYQCGSVYHKTALPRNVHPWQPRIAERYRAAPAIQFEEPDDESVDEPPTAHAGDREA